jgi:hypothetical protein
VCVVTDAIFRSKGPSQKKQRVLQSRIRGRIWFKGRVAAGVDVAIANFGDFGQCSAKKIVVFLKNNVMLKLLHNLALC